MRNSERDAIVEPTLVPRVRPPAEALEQALMQIRDELDLPRGFPPGVEAEARDALANHELPDLDLTAIDFVTIDPPGATDLDQAVHLEREGEGYRVRYAIADVAAFVKPGGAVDTEARERGQTLYAPEFRIPLHPTVISEHAASLLAGEVRSAYVWTFDLDASATVTATALERARIRSRHQFTYGDVQGALDSGTAEPWMLLLEDVGRKRVDLERARGGASLNRPDEEVILEAGRYELVRRRPLPVEAWNAQLSLMTGMAAASIMIDAGVGILRTMPPPDAETLARFRRQVAALGCPWPADLDYGEYLRRLDTTDPRGLAAVHAAASLFRGAGYVAFTDGPPDSVEQAAVAAPYSHATAPLRRLVDRFCLIICEAVLAGRAVPTEVREALGSLPSIMARTSGLASQLDRASVDSIEAALVVARVGEEFDAVVISARENGGVIQIAEPVITATVEGHVEAGQSVRVQLVAADIDAGTLIFRLVPGAA